MALPFLPPASLDSSFTMSCPTKANIDALVKVYYDSFESEPSNTWWWPQDPDAMLEWIRDRIRRKMSDHNVRHFQVLDQQGEVVSFARWDIPKGYEAKFGEWVGSDDDEGALDVSRIVEGGEDDIAKPAVTTAPVEEIAPAAAKTMPAPRGADPELCQYFFTELARLSKKWNATEMLGTLFSHSLLFPSPSSPIPVSRPRLLTRGTRQVCPCSAHPQSTIAAAPPRRCWFQCWPLRTPQVYNPTSRPRPPGGPSMRS